MHFLFVENKFITLLRILFAKVFANSRTIQRTENRKTEMDNILSTIDNILSIVQQPQVGLLQLYIISNKTDNNNTLLHPSCFLKCHQCKRKQNGGAETKIK